MGNVGKEQQKAVEKWEGLSFNCASNLTKHYPIYNIFKLHHH